MTLGKNLGVGNKAKIRLRLDRVAYRPGDQVSGTVYLDVFDRIDIDDVVLKYSGIEKVLFKDSDLHRDHQELFSEKVSLQRCGGLAKGKYEYPFKFQLPSNLPMSLHHPYTQKEAEVLYKVKATVARILNKKTAIELKQGLTEGLALASDLKDVQPIYVITPAPTNTERLSSNTTLEVTSCAFSQGDVCMSVDIEKNHFVPGDTIRGNITVQNNSEQVVKFVALSLYRVVRFQMSGGFRSTEHKALVCSHRQFGVAPGVQRSADFVLGLTPSTLPTSKGYLFECSYYLEAEANLGSNALSIPFRPVVVYVPYDENYTTQCWDWTIDDNRITEVGRDPEEYERPAYKDQAATRSGKEKK
eukprot:Rmarinus@m.11362